jgi:hypothetical protein
MKVILFLLVAFAATPVVAQLKWDNPEQTFAPKPLEKLVIAKYRFTNIGTSPVTINGLPIRREPAYGGSPDQARRRSSRIGPGSTFRGFQYGF